MTNPGLTNNEFMIIIIREYLNNSSYIMIETIKGNITDKAQS